MYNLSDFDFLRALGSSLINSLWQFGIFWIVFRFFLVPIKSISSSVKHGFLILFLSLATGWFVFDILTGYNFPKDALIYSSADAETRGAFLQLWNKAIAFFEHNLPLLSIIYLSIVMVLFANFSRYFFYARNVQTRDLHKPGIDLRLQVSRLAERLSITRKVDIWISGLIDTPMIIGFLKPTILLPIASINQLSVVQLEAILLHELAHIRRNDYLINIYISSLRILFFFNPFCRMLIDSVRQEREKSCDDWVLQFRFDPHQYASALFQLETARSGAFSLGIAAGGANKSFLLERIERILNVKSSRRQGRSNFAGYISALLIMGFVLAFAPAKFEVEKLEKAITIRVPQLSLPSFDNKYFAPTNTVAVRKEVENSDTQVLLTEPANDNTEAEISDVPDADEKDAFAVNYMEAVHVNNVSHTEDRAFSVPSPVAPDLPVVDDELPAPFVPNSSFSFQVVEDTSKPKVKEESYQEHAARESLVKTKKALSQVNWDKLQTELKKAGKLTKETLLQQLEVSLDALNWEKINKEVAESLNQQSIEKWRTSLKIEIEDANKYKQLQQQYQLLKTQLQEAQKNLKKDVEVEKIEVAKEIKRTKTIVHL